VRTVHEGEELGRRDGGQSEDSLWDWVLWVVNDFVIPQGYVIELGDIIIPGNLTGLHPSRPGSYEVDFGELGTIAFEVTP
jgi:2-keto-4-pentenoate hydratase